jgi:hypothetical protein
MSLLGKNVNFTDYDYEFKISKFARARQRTSLQAG